MNDSCAISSPGYSLMGTLVRLLSSSVSVPFHPGSQNPAVAWTIRPSRPRELLWVGTNDRVMRKMPSRAATWIQRTGTLSHRRTAVIVCGVLGPTRDGPGASAAARAGESAAGSESAAAGESPTAGHPANVLKRPDRPHAARIGLRSTLYVLKRPNRSSARGRFGLLSMSGGAPRTRP